MKYKPGESGNPNGRPTGSKNKTPYNLRENINYFLNEKFDEIIKTFDKLQPRDKLKFYIDLIQYSLPRLKTIENFNNEVKTERKPDLSKLSDKQLMQLEEIQKTLFE